MQIQYPDIVSKALNVNILLLDVLDSLDLTMDENKENQTPEGVQGELDWVQQYNLDQEREEQELQQALAQSLQEHVRDPPPP